MVPDALPQSSLRDLVAAKHSAVAEQLDVAEDVMSLEKMD